MGRPWLAASAIAALSWPAFCFAGENAAGVAQLSWSENTISTDLATAPNWNRMPLYVRLSNAPDIQQMALDLRWTPNSIFGPCYFVVPDSTVLTCGQSRSRPPTGSFDGDSSYTWTISFPSESDKSCVKFLVEGGHCDSVAASFCLFSVRTTDSNGAIDTLAIAGGATILGGTSDACPTQLLSVQPSVAHPGVTTTFIIEGADLGSATWVELQSPSDTLSASAVTVLSSSSVSAQVSFADVLAPRYRLAVGNSSGELGSLDDAVESQHTYDVTFTVPLGTWCEPSTHIIQDSCQPLQITCAGLLCPSVLFPNPGTSWNGTAPIEAINAVHLPYTLHFTDNGNPLAGLHFDLTFSPYDRTGGHCHTEDLSSRAALFAQQGNAFVRIDGESDQVSDVNGNFSDDKILPEAAGLIQIHVASRNPNIDLTKTFGLFVGQWGLIDARSQGVEWGQTSQSAHPQYTYVDPFIVNQLKQIRFILNTTRVPQVDSADEIDDPVGSKAAPLLGMFTVGLSTYEDASLPWGGVFDMGDETHGAAFKAPLTWHRRGLSVDLKPSFFPLSATLIKNVLDLQLPSLTPTQAGWMRQRPRYWMHRKGTTTSPRIHLEWGNY